MVPTDPMVPPLRALLWLLLLSSYSQFLDLWAAAASSVIIDLVMASFPDLLRHGLASLGHSKSTQCSGPLLNQSVNSPVTPNNTKNTLLLLKWLLSVQRRNKSLSHASAKNVIIREPRTTMQQLFLLLWGRISQANMIYVGVLKYQWNKADN